MPGKAGVAEALAVRELGKRFDGQIAEGIDSYYLRDLLYGVLDGDEVIPRIYIRAVIAGVQEGRRGYAHMDLPRTRLAQKADETAGGVAPDDRIVDEHDALIPHDLLYGGELYLDLIHAEPLPRGNERASDVFILDKADGIRYSRLKAEPERGVEAGIRHADDYIRLRGMRLGEYAPRLDP